MPLDWSLYPQFRRSTFYLIFEMQSVILVVLNCVRYLVAISRDANLLFKRENPSEQLSHLRLLWNSTLELC